MRFLLEKLMHTDLIVILICKYRKNMYDNTKDFVNYYFHNLYN